MPDAWLQPPPQIPAAQWEVKLLDVLEKGYNTRGDKDHCFPKRNRAVIDSRLIVYIIVIDLVKQKQNRFYGIVVRLCWTKFVYRRTVFIPSRQTLRQIEEDMQFKLVAEAWSIEAIPARKKQHDQYGHQASDMSSGFKARHLVWTACDDISVSFQDTGGSSVVGGGGGGGVHAKGKFAKPFCIKVKLTLKKRRWEKVKAKRKVQAPVWRYVPCN
jgi:hypothetical protein